ncbi:unnamed protein product [Dicrocoelium dendriticum]|nr:unnamed protein product [Dicrocoelium dendriticum]
MMSSSLTMKRLQPNQAARRTPAYPQMSRTEQIKQSGIHWLQIKRMKFKSDYEEHMTYCLCQSLLTNPKNTSAGISLALRLWHQGRTQFATSLLSHFQGSDPNDSLVWLASSHVHAITDAPETRPSQPDYFSYINHASLRDLLHAACLRTNIDVCLHLVNRLFPVLVEAVGWLNNLESRELLCTVESQKIVSFLRLAIEVTTESINRCLAYQPRNPVLWHNRGILLQLAGLSAPAAYCLKKTVKLLSGSRDVIEESRSHLQLAIAQCFLLSFICGSPDWEKADQLVFSSGDFNPTSCASLAEAFAKGLIYLHHPTKTIQLNLAAICLIDEPSRLVRQAVPQALVASSAWPDFGQWILRLFSAESDQMLIEIPGRFLTHSPVLPNHHYLLRTLCNISVTQDKALGPCNLYTVSRRRQIFFEQNTLCFDHGFTGHLLCENGCLRPEEHILWILDNASLCASLSGSLCYGLAWLSRFVIYRPSDPNRWTAVAAWILTHHVISPPAADSFLLKEKNRSKSFPHFWRSFIQAVSTVLRLRLEAPISPLFANIVSECARHWIFIGPPPNLPESAISVMLFSLRRSAAMYPHTPDLLTHLKLFSSLYLPSV